MGNRESDAELEARLRREALAGAVEDGDVTWFDSPLRSIGAGSGLNASGPSRTTPSGAIPTSRPGIPTGEPRLDSGAEDAL